MTHSSEITPLAAEPRTPVLRIAGTITGAILSVGAAAGVIGAARHHGGVDAVSMAIAALFVAIALGCGWAGLRLSRHIAWSGGPRTRSARRMLLLSLLLGLVAGFVLSIGLGETGQLAHQSMPLLSNAPIPPAMAIVLLATLVPAMVLSVKWHLTIDEHERAAYDLGAVSAIYVYFTLCAAWWLAWRGGMAETPDGYVIFWATMATWFAVWLWRRYR